MSRPLSQNPILFYLGYGCSLLSIYFGINAMIRPANALSWFELHPPAATSPLDAIAPGTSTGKELYNLLMPVYGSRNVQAGLVMAVAAWCRHSTILGASIVGFAGAAVVDGWACWMGGQGEWNHWCYVPQLAVLGSLLLGIADGKRKTS